MPNIVMPVVALILRLLPILALAPMLFGASMANAQDAPITPPDAEAVERGHVVWKGSDCIGCHGWAGNGEKIGETPGGPSLRASELDADTLKTIIMCGVPGASMPSHDKLAYTDDRCYGMTKDDIKGMHLLVGKPMTSNQADDLVVYIQSKIMGRPNQPNQDDCRAQYGDRAFCNKYETAAEQGL